MEIHLRSELESRLRENAEQSGRTIDELVAGLVESYLKEVAEIRATIERRWQAYQNGEAKAVDGEECFRLLRDRALERIGGPSKE